MGETVTGRVAILLFEAVLLLGCTSASVSQDRYSGDALIPEPVSFVDSDFRHDGEGIAEGEVIMLTGTVINEQGEPLPGAIVFVKQTDAAGRYRNQAEQADAVDTHFQYEGWIRADESGRFVLTTIAPGSYVRSQKAVPHIHVQARHGKIRSYYKTIMFPQYPPRNGDMSYTNRSDKWTLIVDLTESTDSGIKYAGNFQLVCF